MAEWSESSNVNNGGRHSVLIAYSSHRRCLHYDPAPFREAETHKENVCANKYIIACEFGVIRQQQPHQRQRVREVLIVLNR